jgi:hypothetical protein
MMIQTVIAVRAVSGAGKGLALRHAPQVIFVEIFTLEPFLA